MPLPACLCCPQVDFVCSLHKSEHPANPVVASSKSADCPWDPNDLPDRLRGYGHRGADQDGYDGSEWIWPQDDLEAQMIEAAKVLLDAVEIEVAEGF